MSPTAYETSLPLLTRKEGVELPNNPNLKADLMPLQTTATAWLYRVKRGLLADTVGTGKTIVALSLVTLLKTRKEPYRTIVLVMNAASQTQWMMEIREKTTLDAIAIDGTPKQRKAMYATHWDVAVIRYSTLFRDSAIINMLGADVVIMDEPSAPGVGGHHHSTQTADKMKQLARDVNRVVLLDATPMQSSPFLDLHSLFEIFTPDTFPALPEFERQYICREWARVRRGRHNILESRIIGYRNVGHFKSTIKPYIMRRFDTTGMPEIVSSVEWLALSPEQAKLYDRGMGVITDASDTDFSTERSSAIKSGWHQLQYACDVSTYDEIPKVPTSVKLEWLVRMLKYGSAKSDKVVVFSRYKLPIAHIMQRLKVEGIQAVKLTGDESQDEQIAAYTAFRENPDVRVMVGTTTLERALNLQVARYLIAYNQIYNPGRMTQLAGRVRRRFSEHDTIFVISLLTERTFEERLYAKMGELASVPDYVFGERSDLFQSISENEILTLLRE